jgi:hypothetical protein
MRRYLRQLGAFLTLRSVDAADGALRQFARWMLTDAGITAVGDIRRDDIEDYKVWLAGQPGHHGRLSAKTNRSATRSSPGTSRKARAAAEIPRRPRRRQADGRRWASTDPATGSWSSC